MAGVSSNGRQFTDPISVGQYRNPSNPGAVPAVSIFCDLTSVETMKNMILNAPEEFCDILDDVVENGWANGGNKPNFRRYASETGEWKDRFPTIAEREAEAARTAEVLDSQAEEIAALKAALEAAGASA